MICSLSPTIATVSTSSVVVRIKINLSHIIVIHTEIATPPVAGRLINVNTTFANDSNIIITTTTTTTN